MEADPGVGGAAMASRLVIELAPAVALVGSAKV